MTFARGICMKRPLFALAGATLCALVLPACSDDMAADVVERDRQVRVIVEPLEFNTERTRVEAVGTSRAVQSIAIHPAVSGEVVAVNFEPGQQVEKGEVLIELDQRDEKLAVDLAQVQVADARRLLERYQRTGDSGAVTASALDAASSAVEAARIELDRARIALDYRTIEAPFSGFVGITDIDPGDRVNPDTMITTLDDRSALLVSFEVPETLIGRLTTQDDVEIATWNSREPTAFGEIVDIGSRIDPLTRTFVARALVNNRDDELRPGMSFRVTVDLPGIPYPVIPETGLQWGAEGAYIWSVADNRAHRVPVAIVQRQQGHVLVESPALEEGDLIVVEGIQRVREGMEVTYDRPSLADRALDGGGQAAVGTD
jgi:membrane fusion protein, multidrug efflux system